MKQIIQGLIENVLTALYQPFGCALVLAILIMFLQMFAEEKGWKQAVHCWLINFKTKNIILSGHRERGRKKESVDSGI